MDRRLSTLSRLDANLHTHDDSPYSALDEAEEYVYEPLPDPTYLRILEIQPNRPNEPLVCELHEYADAMHERHERHDPDNETDVVGYEALSWCWAAGTGTRRLHIAGRHITYIVVQEELYVALSALRHATTSRYLWVDRICINQGDNEERNFQVSRMSNVYKDARRVCVWLGRSYQDSDRALEFVSKKLSRAPTYNGFYKDASYLDDWIALRRLIERPWFKRRWIIQEIALAKQAVVYCGGRTIDWNSLQTVINNMIQPDSDVLARLSSLAANMMTLGFTQDYFEEVRSLAAVRLVSLSKRLFDRSVEKKMQATSTLEEIVSSLPMFDNSEPRDTIYALLALAKDTYPLATIPEFIGTHRLDDREREVLAKISSWLPRGLSRDQYRVNYDQPVVDVYQQYISFVIARSPPEKALDVILRPFAPNHKKRTKESTGPAEEDSLPSWIPRIRDSAAWQHEIYYNQHGGGVSALGALHGGGRLFASTPGAESYNAADSKPYNPEKIRYRKRKDHYSMFVEGFILDEVYQVEAPSHSGQIPAGWLTLLRRLNLKRNGEAFWRTLVGDRRPNGHETSHYISILQDMLKSVNANHAFNTREALRKSDNPQVVGCLKHVMSTISGRILIETKVLGLVGLAPQGTQPGDLICILYGCTVPVILRRGKPKDVAQERVEDDSTYLKDREDAIEKLKAWRSKRAVSAGFGSVHNGSEIPNGSNEWAYTAGTPRDEGAAPVKSANTNPLTVVESRQAMHTDGSNGLDVDVPSTKNEVRQVSHMLALLSIARQSRWRRAFLLCLLSVILVYMRPEELSGFMLLGIVAPHILNDFAEPGNRAMGFGLVVMCLGTLVLATYLSSQRTALPLAEGIVIITFSLFPELLPRRSYERLWEYLARTLRAQALFLDRIATLAAGDNHETDLHPTHSEDTLIKDNQQQHPTSIRNSRPSENNARSRVGGERRSKQPPKDHVTELYAFEVIGDAYIDSVMTGKALSMTRHTTPNSERLWTVSFELR